MERRFKKKVDEYIGSFKNEILSELNNQQIDGSLHQHMHAFIQNLPDFQVTKEDFMKRKRVKNMVPMFDRCVAKRASGEQCTRRKKDDSVYCGTHCKGTPHGVISDSDVQSVSNTSRVEVIARDIKGIIYYVDKNLNVYDPEDVLANSNNPKIIAKCKKIGEEYIIDE